MRIGIVVGEGDPWRFFQEVYEDLKSVYPVDVLNVRHWKFPLLYFRLNRLLLRHDLDAFMRKHDVVFFEWATELLAHATLLPKTCRTIVRLHRYEMFQWACRINWSKVDKIILVSQAMQNKFNCQFPDQAHKTMSVPVGVSTEKFRFTEKPFDGNIGILCELTPRKRVYDLILTFDELLRSRPHLRLHIGGGLASGHEDYYEALHHIVDELGLQDRVIFYDRVTEQWNWFRQIDIFVSNSYSEGMQVAPMEAMATGCYCLAHRWLGAEELLPEENLYYTADQLKEKINRYCDLSESDRQKQRERMRAIACAKFDIRQTQARIRQVIEEA